MRRFVIGNWKCYKSLADGQAWFDEFATLYKRTVDLSVVLAPSFVCLEGLADFLRGRQLDDVFLAAQDVSPFPKGAYTGAVAADMVRDLVDYVIIGHSERRRYFHETASDIVNKVNEATDAGLVPIVCIDKPEDLLKLTALQENDIEELIVAYGPVDALNFRIPQSPKEVAGAAAEIRRILPGRPIVYGGAIEMENAGKYADIDGISGLFVGESSLEAATFAAICKVLSAG